MAQNMSNKYSSTWMRISGSERIYVRGHGDGEFLVGGLVLFTLGQGGGNNFFMLGQRGPPFFATHCLSAKGKPH